MNILPSIFVSYNPGSEFEETLAIRLHTIGAVHGFNIFLPDRYYNSQDISIETKNRINLSNYYILFSTTNHLSRIAEQEIQYAHQKLIDKKNIIIIYDAVKGKNMRGTDQCTELFFDRRKENAEKFIARVMDTLKNTHNSKLKIKKQNQDAFAGLVLAGLGLLLLGTALNSK